MDDWDPITFFHLHTVFALTQFGQWRRGRESNVGATNFWGS